MGHDKLRKFAENETFACLLQPSAEEVLADGFDHLRDHPIKGHWFENGLGLVSGKTAASDPVRSSAAHPSQAGAWAPPTYDAVGGTPPGGSSLPGTQLPRLDNAPISAMSGAEPLSQNAVGGTPLGDSSLPEAQLPSPENAPAGTRSEAPAEAKPLILELGCGKGEYTLELARRNPDRNYVGVDIKGARLWRGAKTATEEGLPNVAFLRTRVEFITAFFAPGEVSEIWLTFSDPQPKSENNRLSSPLFLERYRRMLRPGGIVRLKTDSRFLHEYTRAVAEANGLRILACTTDLYGSAGRAVASDPVRGFAAHPSQAGAWAPPSNIAEGGKPLGGNSQPANSTSLYGEAVLPSGVRPAGSPHHPSGAVPPLPCRGWHAPQEEHLPAGLAPGTLDPGAEDIRSEATALQRRIEPEVREVQTFYESMFLEQGVPITYLAFTIDHDGPFVHPAEKFDAAAWRLLDNSRRSFGHQ